MNNALTLLKKRDQVNTLVVKSSGRKETICTAAVVCPGQDSLTKHITI